MHLSVLEECILFAFCQRPIYVRYLVPELFSSVVNNHEHGLYRQITKYGQCKIRIRFIWWFCAMAKKVIMGCRVECFARNPYWWYCLWPCNSKWYSRFEQFTLTSNTNWNISNVYPSAQQLFSPVYEGLVPIISDLFTWYLPFMVIIAKDIRCAVVILI